MNAYNELKQYGLEMKVKADDGKTKDVMVLAIDFFNFNELRQLCINAWGDVKENGEDYCYNRYTRMVGYVSKSTYLQNIDYFEILRAIRNTLLNAVKQ